MKTPKENGGLRIQQQRGGRGERSIFVKLRREHCPSGYCTAPMLRDRLGITEGEFRSLASAGVIAADKHNAGNCALYTEASVQTLLNRQADGSLFKFSDEPRSRKPIAPSSTYTAEDGVKVFELLEQQTPLPQIVLKTRLLPQVVKRIQHDYDDMIGSITVPKTIVEQMNRLRTRLSGPIPVRSATDLLTVLTIAAEDRTCLQCKAVSCADLCVSCLRARLTPPPNDEVKQTTHANGSSTTSDSHATLSQNARQP